MRNDYKRKYWFISFVLICKSDIISTAHKWTIKFLEPKLFTPRTQFSTNLFLSSHYLLSLLIYLLVGFHRCGGFVRPPLAPTLLHPLPHHCPHLLWHFWRSCWDHFWKYRRILTLIWLGFVQGLKDCFPRRLFLMWTWLQRPLQLKKKMIRW